MKPARMDSLILCAILGVLDACTTAGLASSPPLLTTSPVTQETLQMRASDRMFYWIEEARELHAMAGHREREAELMLTQTPGPAASKLVKHIRLLVHQLYQAADYADTQAKEAEREIPLDMLEQLHSALDDSVKADIKASAVTPAAGGASHKISARPMNCLALVE